jgi:hypothetical protein
LPSVAPPQLTEAEIRELENEATFTIQQALATAFLLYLCTLEKAQTTFEGVCG